MANKLNLSNEDIALLLSDQLIILENGLIYRDEQGLPHREDGPASISLNGNYWYRHGLLHREDGPAITWVDGTKKWYQHGKLHRDDGPAVIRKSGITEFWTNGKPACAESVRSMVAKITQES